MHDNNCWICSLNFPSLLRFDEHLRSEHPESLSLLKCPISGCAVDFRDESDGILCNWTWQRIRGHCSLPHNGLCKSCPKMVFGTKKAAYDHAFDIHGETIECSGRVDCKSTIPHRFKEDSSFLCGDCFKLLPKDQKPLTTCTWGWCNEKQSMEPVINIETQKGGSWDQSRARKLKLPSWAMSGANIISTALRKLPNLRAVAKQLDFPLLSAEKITRIANQEVKKKMITRILTAADPEYSKRHNNPLVENSHVCRFVLKSRRRPEESFKRVGSDRKGFRLVSSIGESFWKR